MLIPTPDARHTRQSKHKEAKMWEPPLASRYEKDFKNLFQGDL